MQKESAEICQW